MFVDFLRFCPEGKNFEELFEGFDIAVCFAPCDSGFYPGCIVEANSTKELQKMLKNARGFVGVLSKDVKVNREAVMRRKVDAILDFEERNLDYATLKLAAEKDVVIEVSLSKFLRTRGFRRMKLLDETRLLLKLMLKFKTPFLLTSGAVKLEELRPRKQIYTFFKFLAKDAGLDFERLTKLAEENSRRLFRRLADRNYIMDGLEIEWMEE